MIFITGFPGFIAQRLIKRFLEINPNEKFYALIEPRMRTLAENVRGEIKAVDAVTLVEGDITKPDMGLSGSTLDDVLNNTTYALHLAAIYVLSVPRELAWKVNVDGTRYVLDFLEKMKNLKRFGYISTCYVAGERIGTIYEKELEKGQKFKNFYEETKYEAEVLVRKRLDRIPTVILRPSIVVGDSVTGDIPKFDGPYFALELIRRFRKFKIPVLHIGSANNPCNIVPVDFVVNATVDLLKNDQAVGHTCQLADPTPPLYEDILSEFCKLWDGHKIHIHLPQGLADFLWNRLGFGKLTGVPKESIRYFKYNVCFDTTNTQKFSQVKCPSFKDYAPVMVKYFKEHRKTKL